MCVRGCARLAEGGRGVAAAAAARAPPLSTRPRKHHKNAVRATATPLQNAEVSVLLRNYADAKLNAEPTWQPPPLVQKTRAYVERVNPGRNEEACQQIRE